MHLAWSGDHVHLAERLPEGAGPAAPASSAAASCCGPVRSGSRPGESYRTPWVVFAWSDDGLDGVATRRAPLAAGPPDAPGQARGRSCSTPGRPSTSTTLRPADRRWPTWRPRSASSGSCSTTAGSGGRRDDTGGLGDWYVDAGGLAGRAAPAGRPRPRARHAVRALGRAGDGQPGLRPGPRAPRLGAGRPGPGRPPAGLAAPAGARPGQPGGLRLPARAARRAGRRAPASTTSSGTTTATCTSRCTPAGRPAPARRARADRSPSTGCSTSCAARHPGLEIESCASGGARVDLGILERTDRVWASDCNDAARASAHPALDRAAAAARAGRQPTSGRPSRTPPAAPPRCRSGA